MTSLKAAPSSKDAEESVLGSILLDGVSVYEKVAAWIRDEDAFYYKDNRLIWKAIKEVYKASEPIDVITIADKVKDMNGGSGMSYFITGITNEIPTTANAEYHAKIIWERLSNAGFSFEKTNTEYLGVNKDEQYKNSPSLNNNEIVLRLSVKDQDKNKVNRFGKEIAPVITSGPPGVTGFSGGRPKAQEVIAYWPSLISKNLITTSVKIV